jgi:hypothetical protein
MTGQRLAGRREPFMQLLPDPETCEILEPRSRRIDRHQSPLNQERSRGTVC